MDKSSNNDGANNDKKIKYLQRPKRGKLHFQPPILPVVLFALEWTTESSRTSVCSWEKVSMAVFISLYSNNSD